MSKSIRPATIGMFVSGAIAILLIVLVFLGSGMFSKHDPYVIYFAGSVKGLRVGAPVSFRGVSVGRVTDIKVVFDPKNQNFKTPVLIEINPEQVTVRGESSWMPHGGISQVVQDLIKKGLRAQLELQSLVTGQLQINLDLHKDAPLEYVTGDMPYQQIPSIPSSIEELSKTFEQIPFNELVDDFRETLQGVKDFIASGKIDSIVDETEAMIKKVDRVLDSVQKEIDPLSTELKQAISELTGLLGVAKRTVADLKGAGDKAGDLTGRASQLIDTLNDAGRSLKNLSDFLRRNPEALLRGQQRK